MYLHKLIDCLKEKEKISPTQRIKKLKAMEEVKEVSLKTNVHKHQQEGPAVFLDETVAGIRDGRTREEQRRENTAGKGQCQGG